MTNRGTHEGTEEEINFVKLLRRWDAKFNEFLFLEKFMFVSYFLVIFHDYFIIDSF